jgi:lipoprotein-releasing system permease protein
MSRLPFEVFLALRYLKPKRTFVSVITLISITGVMLGVAVLIVVISVMSGFDKEWQDRILAFVPHLRLYQRAPSEHAPLRDYAAVMSQVRSNSLIVGLAPFIQSQVLLATEPPDGKPSVLVPFLRGIDPDAENSVSGLSTNIVAGKFDLDGHGLLLGSGLAESLKARVGDRVVIYSPSQLEKLRARKPGEPEERPIGRDFTVNGIFSVGFDYYDAYFVVTSLENAQELFELPENSAQGLEIELRNPAEADRVRSGLAKQFGNSYYLTTWTEERPDLFHALATEKNMMFFLLFFIMIVAAFGIVNCQITFVVQKTREIGILKALGATHAQVLWIFLSQSLAVGLLGVSLGFSLGMAALRFRNEFLHFMNRMTGFELLPSTIYHINELPVSYEPGDIALICATAFLACVAAGLFPAWKAATLQPVEALRHE